MEKVRVLEIKQSVFANNDAQADELRRELKEKGIYLMNLMSSPGSGKTTTLKALIAAIRDDLRVGVMEADIDSDVDARAIAATGAKAIQLHTGGMCHLDAGMTRQGLEGLGADDVDLVILEKEFEAASTKFVKMSDDGSWGEKGLVTDALRRLIESGEQYDEVITIGPLPMMKFVCKLTKEYGIKTVASMNPIMIDGTGMCGGCRLTVGGETKFACVDGPEFDGHLIDFDEAIARSSMYRPHEREAHEQVCNLFRKEVK